MWARLSGYSRPTLWRGKTEVLWPATVVGVILGTAVAELPGAILGGVLGHALDRHWRLQLWSDLSQRLGLRPDFTQVLFLCLGRIAKADGRVTEQHLQLARELMQQYRLEESQRVIAIKDFNRGKLPATRVERSLRRWLRQQPQRGAELLDGCWRMAVVQDRHDAAARLLNEWADMAGLSKAEQQRLRQRHQRRQPGSAAPVRTGSSLQQAARLLGVELNAAPEQVKRAYRRLLSRHHPDKLIATGASEAELAAASDKVHQIQQAYEKLRRYHGIR